MSKLDFEDKSYISIERSLSGQLKVSIAARDGLNPRKTVVNSVGIADEQYNELFGEFITKPSPPDKTGNWLDGYQESTLSARERVGAALKEIKDNGELDTVALDAEFIYNVELNELDKTIEEEGYKEPIVIKKKATSKKKVSKKKKKKKVTKKASKNKKTTKNKKKVTNKKEVVEGDED